MRRRLSSAGLSSPALGALALAAVSLSAAGLAGLGAASPARAGDKIPFAKVYLDGDRIIEGEVTAEDDESITIKTDLATAPLPKREVLAITRTQLTTEDLEARRKAKSTYTSLLLGYRLTKADAARWKLDPPSPLSDVAIYDDKERSEISVDGSVDTHPDQPMDDSALEGFTSSIEARLREKYKDVKRISSTKTTLKSEPGFFVELSTTRKESKDEWHQGITVVRHKGKLIFLGVAAPAAHYDKAKAAYQTSLATFDFTEPNPKDGDRLFSQDFLFAIDKPEDWTWAKTPTPKAPTGEVELASPRREATVHLTALALERARTLDAWAKDRWKELEAQPLADAKVSPPTSANICFRRAAQQTTEYGPASARRRRTVYLLKEQEQGYEIALDLPAEKGALLPIANEVVSRFRILNALLSEGALEKGLKAIDLFDEGDKALSDNKNPEAAALYENAVDVFPRFAAAWNNLALARARSGDFEKASAAASRAYDLFPEDRLIRSNAALIRLHEVGALVKDKKPDEAARLCDQARAAAPPEMDDSLRAGLASCYFAVACAYAEKDNYDKAAALIDKALAIKPKDADILKNAAIICSNAAVSNWNKKSTGAASSWAKRALKYDPTNAKAKEILDLVAKKK